MAELKVGSAGGQSHGIYQLFARLVGPALIVLSVIVFAGVVFRAYSAMRPPLPPDTDSAEYIRPRQEALNRWALDYQRAESLIEELSSMNDSGQFDGALVAHREQMGIALTQMCHTVVAIPDNIPAQASAFLRQELSVCLIDDLLHPWPFDMCCPIINGLSTDY